MKDEPKQKDGQRLMPVIQGVVTLVMIAFGLICYFKSMHTMQESHKRTTDSILRIVDDLMDMYDQKKGCYCQPEDEP